MTYHVHLESYACPECQQAYIPCTIDQKCPKCGYYDPNVGQYRNFAHEVAKSMKAHKHEFGQYHPPAWASSSQSERLQSVCFNFFDYLEAGQSGSFLEILDLIQLDNKDAQKYQRELVSAVYEIWISDPWFTKGPSWWEKFSRRLSQFLP